MPVLKGDILSFIITFVSTILNPATEDLSICHIAFEINKNFHCLCVCSDWDRGDIQQHQRDLPGELCILGEVPTSCSEAHPRDAPTPWSVVAQGRIYKGEKSTKEQRCAILHWRWQWLSLDVHLEECFYYSVITIYVFAHPQLYMLISYVLTWIVTQT